MNTKNQYVKGNKKTLGSQSSEENTSKIISGENEDHSLTPSASLISSEISQDEISKESLKENSDDIEEHVDLSEKSGLTQSEIKNTVIQETTNTAQENDNTENDLNISEDLEVLSEAAETLSSEKSSRSTETITDSSNKSGNKKDETQKSNAEISAQSLDDKKIKKENLVDDITENIFQWLYTDTVDTIKTRTLNQKIISSSENSSTEIVDKSKKKPSDFISENLSEYLIEDSVDCMLQITREKKDINISASESKNVKKDVSDITEKVTRILATLNDRKSVQSKSRPQDLMILSPLLDNLEDNNWEITTDLEIEKAEMTSSFEPVLLNQKSDFLEESEWFDDDFGFENKEAQLAQEEMPPHYQNYYRQIPNKPPPPYIPPSALPFSKFEPKKNESFSVIVNDPKEIQDMVTEMALTLKDNINIYQFNEENAENSDLATESQVLYKQFLCDLTRDMILNLNSKANEKPAPWTKTWKLTQKSFPRDGEQFVNTVVEKTLQLLGIKNIATESKKNESVMKLGRKKRDFVDNILIKELREEECSWVNYEQDEIFIKTELSDAIFDILVDDTVSLIGKLQQRV
ncbi:centrosome-associated protein 350-like [Centruroides sculpturatus]|uniref:centrosome-associated protein 350-like n=1 Tax=Centruroides sculpturatus TaxID=218467 RepID=UPI000C6E5B16|nr:centrosome-associated protein 350-like [Centruroides sculpturatus]